MQWCVTAIEHLDRLIDIEILLTMLLLIGPKNKVAIKAGAISKEIESVQQSSQFNVEESQRYY